MELLDFSEYSDTPLLTSVTTHRPAAAAAQRGLNDMVRALLLLLAAVFKREVWLRPEVGRTKVGR